MLEQSPERSRVASVVQSPATSVTPKGAARYVVFAVGRAHHCCRSAASGCRTPTAGPVPTRGLGSTKRRGVLRMGSMGFSARHVVVDSRATVQALTQKSHREQWDGSGAKPRVCLGAGAGGLRRCRTLDCSPWAGASRRLGGATMLRPSRPAVTADTRSPWTGSGCCLRCLGVGRKRCGGEP